jgi:hypothetical protein
MKNRLGVGIVVTACALFAYAGTTAANSLYFSTSEISNYLLVGMGPHNAVNGDPGVGNAAKTSNFELGAQQNPVPSPSNPTLASGNPPIPSNAQPVGVGITYDGNIAVTHTTGTFNFSNVNI